MVTTHNLGLANNINQSSQAVLQQQKAADFVSLGCSSVADPMVTMMNLLGHRSEFKHLKAYQDAPWFGSEARYVVPEFTPKTSFTLDTTALINEVEQAKQQGLKVKPIIIGPVSYLWFSATKGNVNKLEYLESLLNVYADLLKELPDADIEWVQLDEPVLTQELNEDWKHAILQAYFHLQRSPVKKLLACYFGKLGDNLGLLRELTVDGVHLDTISADDEALKVADWLPNYKIVSVAVVDGSQNTDTDFEDIFFEDTDFKDTLAWLKPIHEILGDRLWLAPSCRLNNVTEETTQQKFADIKQISETLMKSEESVVESKVAA